MFKELVNAGYESYVIPGETLIPGGGTGRGKRLGEVLDMHHI